MSILRKKSKKAIELCENHEAHTSEFENHAEPIERPIRAIIDGKMYDTSKAKKIGSVVVRENEISGSKLDFCTYGGQEVIIYKGNTKYFIRYYCYLQPVSEAWVREWLGKQNIEKYIELFGEPELA